MDTKIKSTKFKNQINLKSILSIAIIAAGLFVGGAMAQTSTDPVTVNVVLNTMQSITVNIGQTNVNLIYNSLDDYRDGVSSPQEDHLTISSTGAYAVLVETNIDGLTIDEEDPLEDGETITIQASLGTPGAFSGTEDFPAVDALSASGTPVTLIENDDEGAYASVRSYDVTYSAAGSYAYISKILENSSTEYDITVTYTIVTP